MGSHSCLPGVPDLLTIEMKQSGVPQSVVGGAFGNAISLNVLERLLCRLLPACGLSKPLVDFWANLGRDVSSKKALGESVHM